MDTTNATTEPDEGGATPPAEDDLSIDWGAVEHPVDAVAPDRGLALPADLFGPDPGTDDGPEPLAVEEIPAEAPAPEEPAAFVLDDLFPDAPGADEPQEPTVVVEEDLFAAAATTAVTPAPPLAKPRLAPERRQFGPTRRTFDRRKAWMVAAAVAALAGLATLLNQPEDPSVDVRSAASPEPAPTVPASTTPVPTTAAATSSSTALTTPSTTPAETPATASTVAPAPTGGTAPAGPATTAAPRPTVAPSPVTTAAPPPVVTPTSAATTVPEPVTTEPPPPDTTPTTRRPRETIPPATTTPSTTTTVGPDEVGEVE